MTTVKNIFITLAVAFIFIVIQGSVLGSVIPSGFVPNLCLVLCVYLGAKEMNSAGAILAFLSGLMIDMFSGVMLGPWAGAFILLFFVLSIVGQRLFLESSFTVILLVFVSSILVNFTYLMLLYRFQSTAIHLFPKTFITSLVTAVFSPVCFKFFNLLLSGKPEMSGRTSKRLSDGFVSMLR